MDEPLPSWTPGNPSTAFLGPIPDLHLSEGDYYYDGIGNGSPVKRPSVRPRLDRAATFNGDARTALDDITKAHANFMQSLARGSATGSPVKTPGNKQIGRMRRGVEDVFDVENMMPAGGLGLMEGSKAVSPLGLFGDDEYLPDDSGIDGLFDLTEEIGGFRTPVKGEEEEEEDSGIDLLGGFSKIGAIRSARKRTPVRPGMARALTTTF